MFNLEAMIGSCTLGIDAERNEIRTEIEERNRINREEFDTAQENAAMVTIRTKLNGLYPQHKDILVNEDGDPVAWFNEPEGTELWGEWVFKSHDDMSENGNGMDIKQQYYNRNTGVAEWVSMYALEDGWDFGWNS